MRANVPTWSPHRLRHNAATFLRKEFGLEAAQIMLGHKNADATQIYAEINREKALDLAQSETIADPENAFAWFNLGSNQIYFENYSEAGQAYDTARQIGLPQRMMRYQFGPFFAYFFSYCRR